MRVFDLHPHVLALQHAAVPLLGVHLDLSVAHDPVQLIYLLALALVQDGGQIQLALYLNIVVEADLLGLDGLKAVKVELSGCKGTMRRLGQRIRYLFLRIRVPPQFSLGHWGSFVLSFLVHR